MSFFGFNLVQIDGFVCIEFRSNMYWLGPGPSNVSKRTPRLYIGNWYVQSIAGFVKALIRTLNDEDSLNYEDSLNDEDSLRGDFLFQMCEVL